MAPRERLLLRGNALLIHAARGEAMDDGLAEMERLGMEMSDYWHIFVADPMAQRALAHGDAKAARDFYVEIADHDEGTAHEFIYRAARPAAWLGDVEAVRAYLERVESMGGYGPILSGRLQSIRADVAALEGRTADALVLYRDALRNFHSAKAMYDAALVGLDMAKLLDPADPEVSAAIASSREFFERVGAKPFLEQLDAAASRGGQQSSGPARVRKAEVATANP